MIAYRAGEDCKSNLICLDESMAEVALLVPNWQAQALVEAAQEQGVTVGQFLRRLLDRALPRTCRAV